MRFQPWGHRLGAGRPRESRQPDLSEGCTPEQVRGDTPEDNGPRPGLYLAQLRRAEGRAANDMREASKEWPEMVDFPPEDAGKPSQGPFHCLWTMGPGGGEEEDRKEGFLGFHEASLLVASLQVGMVRMGREVA